jgi:thymidylate kinase
MSSEKLLIAIVGPCAAGKSTLADSLDYLDCTFRQVAQEHSYVQEMWKLFTNPDFLIYLDVSYSVSIARSKNSWKEEIFNKQIERLQHARENADLYIQTDQLEPEEITRQVKTALVDKFPLIDKERGRN